MDILLNGEPCRIQLEVSVAELLEQRDLARRRVAVEVNGVVSVVPDANARQLPVPVYSDLKFKAADDELVNVLLTLKNACSGQLVPVLRPLMPQAAHLAADIQSNTLIIDDRAANVRRIGEMTERLDRAAPAGQKCQPTTAN